MEEPPVPGRITIREPSAKTTTRRKAGDGAAFARAVCNKLRAALKFAGVALSASLRGQMGPNATASSRNGFDKVGNAERSPDTKASMRNAPGATNPSSIAVVSSGAVAPKEIETPGTPARTIN